MPRSRRKAAQIKAKTSGVAKDFIKKKERLGKKARAANATNTSVRSKHIYLPDARIVDEQDEDHSKKGLSLPELISRAGHYNASTRTSALNALTKAVSQENAAASAHARADLASVLRIALNALQDEVLAVRNAANAVLAAILKEAATVRPFAVLLSAKIGACLSHIRTDIQLSGARAVATIFLKTSVHPLQLFGTDPAVLLNSLSDLLASTKASRHRTVILDAIYSLTRPRNASSPRTERRNIRGPKAFYYHRDVNRDGRGNSSISGNMSLLSVLSLEDSNLLMQRVANVIAEVLPVHEAKKDKDQSAVLVSSTKTLCYLVDASTLSDDIRRHVARILDAWSTERNRHHDRGQFHDIHNFLAHCAIRVETWDSAGAYLRPALALDIATPLRSREISDRDPDFSPVSLEDLTIVCLRSCPDEAMRTNVLRAWIARWERAMDVGNTQYFVQAAAILEELASEYIKGLQKAEWSTLGIKEGGQKLLFQLPHVVRKVADEAFAMLISGQGPHESESLCYFCERSIALVAKAGRVYCALEQNDALDLKTAICDKLLEHKVVLCLGEESVSEMISMLFYTRAFASFRAVELLAEAFLASPTLKPAFQNISLHFCARLLTLMESSNDLMARLIQGDLELELLAALSAIRDSDHIRNPEMSHCRSLCESITEMANRLYLRLDA